MIEHRLVKLERRVEALERRLSENADTSAQVSAEPDPPSEGWQPGYNCAPLPDEPSISDSTIGLLRAGDVLGGIFATIEGKERLVVPGADCAAILRALGETP